MDGLIVVDKPEGPSSHDVVARVRRALGERRIGHTGTLDPLATGVLPLVLGRATRLARFITADVKRYRATIRLGWATTTHDRLGEALTPRVTPEGLTREAVDRALDRFRGTFMQTPPAFSAKKLAGTRAYDLARRGLPVTPAATLVTVHDLTLVSFNRDLVVVDVTGSAGFYVRSLAHDLGRGFEVGAHLTALRRTAAGALTERDALPLADIEADPAGCEARVRPLTALLPSWPAARTTAGGLDRTRRGLPLRPADCLVWPTREPEAEGGAGAAGGSRTGDVCVRIEADDGALVALAAWTGAADGAGDLLHPRVVLV